MKIQIILISGLCLLLLSSCSEKERHTYTAEDRPEMFINQNLSRLYNPGMDTNTGMADLVAQVEITSDQVIDEVTTPEGVPWTFCHYNAELEDVWYGEPVNNDIRIYFHGTDAVLHQYDKAVVYLMYDEENYYVPVDGEYSIFILNPPGDEIFPFAMVSEYDLLEGESVSHLREQTDDAFERVLNGESDVYPSGAVFDLYQSNDLHNGDVD